MDPMITGLGVVALMGAAATIAGAAEDLESDVGSQSNPNSQVQLAPADGAPAPYNQQGRVRGTRCIRYLVRNCGSVAYMLLNSMQLPVIMAIAVGSVIAAMVHTTYAVTSHMGRIVSQSQFNQPLFMDMLVQHLAR